MVWHLNGRDFGLKEVPVDDSSSFEKVSMGFSGIFEPKWYSRMLPQMCAAILESCYRKWRVVQLRTIWFLRWPIGAKVMGEIWKCWVGNECECGVCGGLGTLGTLYQVGWYSLVGSWLH